MAHLVVSAPGQLALAVPVGDGFRIGRQAGCDLVLHDAKVSRVHAELRAADDGLAVHDLGSTHGVYVNAERIERHVLVDGDRVQVGAALLEYREGDADDTVAHRLTAVGGAGTGTGAAGRLGVLTRLAACLERTGPVEQVAGDALTAVVDALGCARGVIALVGEPGQVRIVAAAGGAAGQPAVVVSRALVTAMIERRESVLIAGGALPRTLAAADMRSALGAPLVRGGVADGFVYVEDARGDAFGPDDLAFFTAVAHLLAGVLDGAERAARAAEILRLAEGVADIRGSSPAIAAVREQIVQVAAAAATHVFVRGESGSGKELVARNLHALSPRAERPFVAVNCAALPDTMLEAELFGHTRGAFTGAARARRGRFQLADGGTLFLDEIGDLSLAAQAKVLRAVERGEVTALGSEKVERVDVRVVSATHRDLWAAVEDGAFRQDLLFRLAVVEIAVPPLRERGDDVIELADWFVAELTPRVGKRVRGLTVAARSALLRYGFPGNVRELRNEIERALILSRGPAIDVSDLSPRIARPAPPADPERSATLAERYAALDTTERALVEEALRSASGNLAEAARLLGISWIMMRRRVQRFGLTVNPG